MMLSLPVFGLVGCIMDNLGLTNIKISQTIILWRNIFTETILFIFGACFIINKWHVVRIWSLKSVIFHFGSLSTSLNNKLDFRILSILIWNANLATFLWSDLKCRIADLGIDNTWSDELTRLVLVLLSFIVLLFDQYFITLLINCTLNWANYR